MAQPIWQTAAGSLGVVPEGVFYQQNIVATDADLGPVTYALIAGVLPAGIQCTTTGQIVGVPQAAASIQGVPVSVNQDVTSKFVIRATATGRIADRTFELTVTGNDVPQFLTPAGSIGTFYDGGQVDIQIVFANTHTYTSTATIGSTYTGHVRVTRQASSGEIKFYTSTNGSTWNQLGSTITGITTVYTAQAYLQVGSYWNGSASLSFNGKIYTLTYSDTINGTPTESIDLASYNAAVSQTTWTSTTGETWTLIKPTANNIYYSSVVVRTTVQLRFGYNWLETSLNPLPLGNITQMNLGSINAAPASSGGSIFRSALVQTRDGFYYNYSIFTGSENSDEILNSYFTTFSPIIKHGINVLNYKTQFFTQRVQSGVSCKVYLNNNLLTTGNTSAWLAYNITRIGGYSAFTLNQNNNGVFTFNSLLSEANTFAFQSFVNTSLMNNELW